MFETLESFSIVYWSLAVVLVLLVLFEKHLIAFEDKVKAKRRKRARKEGIK